jgi:hypothetical protein
MCAQKGEERFSSTLSLTFAVDGASGESHAPAALTPSPCSVKYCDLCTVRHKQLLWIARTVQVIAECSIRHDSILPDVDCWAISWTAWGRRFSFDFVQNECCWHVTSCNSVTVGLWGTVRPRAWLFAQSLLTVRFPTRLSSLSVSLICSSTYP